MPVTLLASACPSPQFRSAFLSISGASTSPGNAPVSDSIVTGERTSLSEKLRRNATRADLVGAYGGGGYGIVNGLDLSIGTGLILNIARGLAMIDSVVAVENATTLAVTGSIARIWIWLLQNGTITSVNNSTTPPVGACCLLGSCVTGSSSITSVDTSGVMYLRGGNLCRETADTTTPADTPGSGIVFYTKTISGTYLWDGTTHNRLSGSLSYVVDAIPAGTTETVPSNAEALSMDTLDVSGTLDVYGDLYVLPTTIDRPYLRHIFNVRDYGATGDGKTNDTAAIQSALVAARSLPGSQVLFADGVFAISNVQTGNLTDVEITGSGATILVTGDGGGATHGFEMSGTLDNVTFRGLHFKGQSGSAADKQCGIFSFSGVNMTYVRVEDCEFEYLTNSVSFNTNDSGSQFGCSATRCYVHDGLMVGDLSEGYGVHCADGTGNPINFSVTDCVFDKTARHAVYIAKCVGAVVANCRFYRHRLNTYTGNPRYALVVQRSMDVAITGCVFENGYDGALGLTKTATQGANYTVTGCTFTNPANAIPPICIGSQGPATASDGSPTNVVVQGCVFRSDAGSTIDMIRLFSGYYITIANCSFYQAGQSATTYAVEIDTRDETAGTATYSDALHFVNNTFVMIGSGTNRAIRLQSAACTSAVKMVFAGNRAYGSSVTMFSSGASITNPNVEVSLQSTGGVSWSGTTTYATVSQGSPIDTLTLNGATPLTIAGQATPIINAVSPTDATFNLDLDITGLTAAAANWRFGRRTNTTGSVRLLVLKGDNTATVNGQISGNSTSHTYFAANNGNVAVGGTGSFGGGDGVLFLDAARTAPTSNPASGIILWWDGTNLKYRTPSGATGNIV